MLARLAPVRQHVLLALTLADVAGGSHSLPELRFLDLVRGAGLPLPDRQVVRRRADGQYVLDAHWERYGVTVEVERLTGAYKNLTRYVSLDCPARLDREGARAALLRHHADHNA